LMTKMPAVSAFITSNFMLSMLRLSSISAKWSNANDASAKQLQPAYESRKNRNSGI
jgi:hypothetical protein